MSNSLLWLDDEPETLSAIADEIERTLNLDVEIVPTIEEFLIAISSKKFRMILFDIGVPLSTGHQYPEDFLRFLKNEKYAGSAALSYVSELNAQLGEPEIFVCSGHAPEFVNETLVEQIAYQYVNKSMIFLGPQNFIAELGFGDQTPTPAPLEPIPTKLDDSKLHDVRIRLLQISNVISSVTQSASRMLDVEGIQSPRDFDFEKAVRREFDFIAITLEEIDAHKHAEFIDDVDDLLEVANTAGKKGFVTSQSMIIEAVFEAIKRSRRHNFQNGHQITKSLEKILHLFNYSTISQQAADIAYTASLLGIPKKLDNKSVSFRGIIEAEANSLQPEAASRNLEIRPDLKSDQKIDSRYVNRFRSAFYNVLSNAVKYNGQTGRKRTWVDVRLSESEQSILVEVESWGDPLPKEEREFLTQRNFRGSNSKRLGFGLGLTIANEHVEAMGGELKFDVRDAGNNRTPKEIFTVSIVVPHTQAVACKK